MSRTKVIAIVWIIGMSQLASGRRQLGRKKKLSIFYDSATPRPLPSYDIHLKDQAPIFCSPRNPMATRDPCIWCQKPSGRSRISTSFGKCGKGMDGTGDTKYSILMFPPQGSRAILSSFDGENRPILFSQKAKTRHGDGTDASLRVDSGMEYFRVFFFFFSRHQIGDRRSSLYSRAIPARQRRPRRISEFERYFAGPSGTTHQQKPFSDRGKRVSNSYSTPATICFLDKSNVSVIPIKAHY